MTYYNPDGSINASTSDGIGYYNKDGSVAVSIKTPIDLSSYMSSTVPPPVNSTGAIGTGTQFARSDHTHVSSVFKAVKVTTDGSGTVSWTYPSGFFTDPPVVVMTVETTSGQPMTALITGNSATGGTAQVLRAQTLPANLTLLSALVSFNVFGGSVPVGTRVHVFAGKANG